jgi:hypothetical protein
MSKPTVDDIAWALYVIGVSYRGTCPYCTYRISDGEGHISKDLVDTHWNQQHTGEGTSK